MPSMSIASNAERTTSSDSMAFSKAMRLTIFSTSASFLLASLSFGMTLQTLRKSLSASLYLSSAMLADARR